MAIVKDLEIKIVNDEARLSEKVYVYQNDGDVELRLKLNLVRVNYRSAIRTAIFETSELYAGATVKKPNGTLLSRGRVRVIDNIIPFTIDKELTDNVDEIGIYLVQFHLYDSLGNRITIPPIEFEVKELIGNIAEDGTLQEYAIVDRGRVGLCVIPKGE